MTTTYDQNLAILNSIKKGNPLLNLTYDEIAGYFEGLDLDHMDDNLLRELEKIRPIWEVVSATAPTVNMSALHIDYMGIAKANERIERDISVSVKTLKQSKRIRKQSEKFNIDMKAAHIAVKDIAKHQAIFKKNLPFIRVAIQAQLMESAYKQSGNLLIPFYVIAEHEKEEMELPIWVENEVKKLSLEIFNAPDVDNRLSKITSKSNRKKFDQLLLNIKILQHYIELEHTEGGKEAVLVYATAEHFGLSTEGSRVRDILRESRPIVKARSGSFNKQYRSGQITFV